MLWYYIYSLYSNFVTSSSCLSIYTLILNFIVNWFTFKSSKAVLQKVFWNVLCIFFMFTFMYIHVYFYVFFSCLILFTSTEFCMILMQFDVIQGRLKLIFRLHSKNMLNYTWVEISNLLLRQGWNNCRAEISTRFSM